ncbi:MAG: sugar ABC transporter ATP-binding protein [Clostridiales Family XIII bacterium]|jgi:ribose transport system ATP-binding protein|nr:sugar ABC transporter ATP-binding protein [Clostridiales Family XIII bacterium]
MSNTINDDRLFECKGITKIYGNTKALDDIGFSVGKGEIVGLVGENGAGKSTLMKIMQGVEMPTSGEMSMQGIPYTPKNSNDANAKGIGMVFQEQSLITNLTVAQNMYLGEEDKYRKFGIVNWGRMSKDADEMLKSLSLSDISGNQKVSDIQFSRRQMIEIAKVLSKAKSATEGGALILLDEPTSVLNAEEIATLFAEMKKLKEDGNGVVFISHRLEEVIDISDKIVVFKDGKCVAELKGGNITEETIFEKMIGKSSSGEFYRTNKQCDPGENVLIESHGLGLFGYFKDVDFTLRAGEVIGIYGVVGSGKEHLCDVLAGDLKHTSGDLKVSGKSVRLSSPGAALRHSIACIPTERRVDGQVGMATVRENITYSSLHRCMSGGFISIKKERESASEWIDKLKIKCEDCEQPMENLSGGNAQKVVFARVLSSDTDIIILNHPTRGVDVGAKEEIYDIVREATAAGKGVILLGDTLDECIGLSNEILVMKDGLITMKIAAPSHNKPDQLTILQHMM